MLDSDRRRIELAYSLMLTVECNEPVNTKWTENGVVASAGWTPTAGVPSGRRGVHSQAIAGRGGVTHRGQAVIVAQPHPAHH
jgi:hypothetical protein